MREPEIHTSAGNLEVLGRVLAQHRVTLEHSHRFLAVVGDNDLGHMVRRALDLDREGAERGGSTGKGEQGDDVGNHVCGGMRLATGDLG